MHLSNNELQALENAQSKKLAPLGYRIIQNDIWLHAYLSLERYGLGRVVEAEYGIGKAFNIATRKTSRFEPVHIGAMHSSGLRLALYRVYAEKEAVLTLLNKEWIQVLEELSDMGFGELAKSIDGTGMHFHPNAMALEWLKVQPLDEQDKLVLKYFTAGEGGAKEFINELHYGYPKNLRAAFYLEVMGLGVRNHDNEELPYFVATREGHEEGKRLQEADTNTTAA